MVIDMIVVALNNPGEKYERTRHNAGLIALEHAFPHLEWEKNKFVLSYIAKEMLNECEVIFARPETYMNDSGLAVRKLLPHYNKTVNDLVVIHDDIDLPIGSIKISKGRGDGGHNGIKSITNLLESNEYIRIRVGIAKREFFEEGMKLSTKDIAHSFVLGEFDASDRESLKKVGENLREVLTLILSHSLEKAMNTYNA